MAVDSSMAGPRTEPEARPHAGFDMERVVVDHTRPPVQQREVPLRDFLAIPKERYMCPDFAKLEAEKLWRKVWQVACREEEIREVGDYIEYQIVGISILVVRTAPDLVKAFFNTCLHRGARLKADCGNAREIMCRWHGWRWKLDGSIKGVVDEHLFQPEQIDPESLRLPECRVGLWAGNVYINMDPDCESLREFLGPVPERMARYELDKMRLVRFRTTVVPANWKTCIDAFNESYHAQANHPQIGIYMDDTSYIYENYDVHNMLIPKPHAFGNPTSRLGDYVPERAEIVMTALDDFAGLGLVDENAHAMAQQAVEAAEALPEGASLHTFFAAGRRAEAQARGLNVDDVDDDDLLLGEDWNVFPNVTAPLNVLGAFMFRFRPNGLDPDSALIDVLVLERPTAGTEPPKVKREFIENWRDEDWGRIMNQDLEMMPNFQIGLRSPAFTHFRFGADEINIVNFHRVLMEYLSR